MCFAMAAIDNSEDKDYERKILIGDGISGEKIVGTGVSCN